MKTPIEVLQDNLDELERAKNKSRKAYEEDKIEWLVHLQHMENLAPLIKIYKAAILILNQYPQL